MRVLPFQWPNLPWHLWLCCQPGYLNHSLEKSSSEISVPVFKPSLTHSLSSSSRGLMKAQRFIFSLCLSPYLYHYVHSSPPPPPISLPTIVCPFSLLMPSSPYFYLSPSPSYSSVSPFPSLPLSLLLFSPLPSSLLLSSIPYELFSYRSPSSPPSFLPIFSLTSFLTPSCNLSRSTFPSLPASAIQVDPHVLFSEFNFKLISTFTGLKVWIILRSRSWDEFSFSVNEM